MGLAREIEKLHDTLCKIRLEIRIYNQIHGLVVGKKLFYPVVLNRYDQKQIVTLECKLR